jgi:uncharacterized membrane protein SirB2
MLSILKITHLTFITLSFLLFCIRGYLMLHKLNTSNSRIFLFAPHLINALLISSGVGLAVALHLNPATEVWLATKLAALIAYIILGIISFKHPKHIIKKMCWLLALLDFMFMASVAYSKNPLGFFTLT